MDGLWVDGRRPKSKKEVAEAAASRPEAMVVEHLSIMDRRGSTPVLTLPAGTRISFVGPDPHVRRKFYGVLIVTANGLRVE